MSPKKKFNRHTVLHEIRRHGPVGRLQVSRQLHISKSRVCEIVQELLDEKLILEDLNRSERRGRLPIPLRVNPEHGQFLGFDFEAKRMRLVIVDFAGNVIWRHQVKLKPFKSRQPFVNHLLSFIEEGLKRIHSQSVTPLGIGLAAPGVIDRRRGTLLHYDLIEVAQNIPLRDLVANRTNLPCLIDNNIRAYALEEWMSGAAQHLSNFICLAVRSGVGAAIMQNGRLSGGSHGFSGEAGYFPIPAGGAASQWRTFQETVSEQALGIDVEAKNSHLPEARAKRAGELVGAQIAALVSLLDPEAVVLAGGLIQPNGSLWSSLERTYRRFVLPDIAERVQLLPSRVGPFAAAIGATHQCFRMLYATEQEV